MQTPRKESPAPKDARSARPGEELQEEAHAELDPDEVGGGGSERERGGGQPQQQRFPGHSREGVRGAAVQACRGPGSGGGDDAAPLINEGCERGCVATREAEGEAEDEA